MVYRGCLQRGGLPCSHESKNPVRIEYLQLVENRKEKGKVKQRVIATVGRMDQLQEKGRIETLIRSLSRFSEKALLVLSGQSDLAVEAKTIGTDADLRAIVEAKRHCRLHPVPDGRAQVRIRRGAGDFHDRGHRLLVSGSDRFCERWRRDYFLPGCEHLDLHHLYRAMGFLGEELSDQTDATPFTPRRTKDRIEEMLFAEKPRFVQRTGAGVFRHDLDLLRRRRRGAFWPQGIQQRPPPGSFPDGCRGRARWQRSPHLLRDVAGQHHRCHNADTGGGRIRKRFGVSNFCVVADRGMISAETLKRLEENNIGYILGCRMRKVKEIQTEVLTRAGRYREVYPESADRKQAGAVEGQGGPSRGQALHRLRQRAARPARTPPIGRPSLTPCCSS